LMFGEQIARALQDAHEHGIVHCDLKPGNIMVTAREQVKLLDFGLARLLKTTDSATTEALIDEQGLGTLPYMAPEQIRGESDFRTDIYALGALLYEMCTGEKLFPNLYGVTLVSAILNSAPKRPTVVNPQVSKALEGVILKAIDKDTRIRYQ